MLKISLKKAGLYIIINQLKYETNSKIIYNIGG